MKNTCVVCQEVVEGVKKGVNYPEGVYFNFLCSGCGSYWTRMLPPLDTTGDQSYQEIQASERVLVRIEHGGCLYFARYFHKSERWSVEGCHGSIKVIEWWPIPSGQGVLV